MNDEQYAPAGKKLWLSAIKGNVLVLGLVSLFTDVASEMVYPLLPVFFTGLVPMGTAAVYVGLMEGIAESTSGLLKIASGKISDMIGRRKILAVVGYGLSSLARPFNALAGAGSHVIGLRFADRVGKGLRTSPRDALISDSVDHRVRGLAFSFHRAMDHTGAVLGPVLAVGILYAFLGYGLWHGASAQATDDEMHAMRWLFAITAVPGLIATLLIATRAREVVPRPEKKASEEADVPKSALPKKFYFFVGIVTLFALGNSSDLFLLFYGRTKFQFGLLQLMGLWVALHLSKILFSLPGGIASDKLGRRPVIVAGWIVYTAVYIGMAGVSSAWLFWMLMVVYGFYYGATEGAEKALVSDFVPSKGRGTAYGIYHGAVGLAALPASLLFGVFWSALGPARAFGIAAGLAGLASILLTILLAGFTPHPQSSSPAT